MTEFLANFWTWATDHWFLGCIILCVAIIAASIIISSFFRIFHRPQAKYVVQLRDGQQQELPPELRAMVDTLRAAAGVQAPRPVRPVTPIRPPTPPRLVPPLPPAMTSVSFRSQTTRALERNAADPPPKPVAKPRGKKKEDPPPGPKTIYEHIQKNADDDEYD